MDGNLLTCYSTVHNSVEILTTIISKSRYQKEEKRGMSPSEYIKQMLMSTQERIDYLLKPGRSINIQSLYDDAECSCFKIIPRIILFQQFVPGNVYNVTLTIRNVTKVSRHLKISYDPVPSLSVEYYGSNYSTMIAPGLVHVYNVRFSPTEKRDHEYRIMFINDTEFFAVPIIAIGPRPILDIPDRIEIPSTAVKISSSKTILVRNIGDAPAVFNFAYDNPCFSVEPSKGILGEEEAMQFTVNFLSEKSGDFRANLFLNYESGETISLELWSSAINCTVRIDRGSVRMEETYLGLSRSKILTIHNRSDYIVKFQWMSFKDKDADTQRKDEYRKLFQLVHNAETVRCVSLVHYNICLPDIHELVCQRIYADEIASLMNENFHYNHMCFLLTPEEGEIWPQSTMDVMVIFRAMEIGEISSVAYLEVTGREDRIPLSLHGTGKGPVFRLNVVTIDLKNIFLCSVHNYEIIAANKSHIRGTLVYKAKPTDFGGTINVTPSALTLEPDEYKSFSLSFSSNRKGDFVERIDFITKESLEVLSLHIKGCIVSPTLQFDRSSLDFGRIALGFSKREEVWLRNLSLISVSFNVTVIDDGDQTALTYEEFTRTEIKPSFPASPREFTIIPQQGVVHAHNSFKLKVTYTANVARSGRLSIRVDMWDSDSDPVILPVTFCGAIPSLSIDPTEICLQFCFINFPYSRSVTVQNNSDLDSYFYIIPQAVFENIPVVYSISSHQGFLKAQQSKAIDITIITKALGRQTAMLNMLTMGEQAPVASCTIICNGQGPVVTVQPTCLDFGKVQVLQEKVMNFCIINDSPVPAQFKVTSGKKNSLWLVEPNSGELRANESIEVVVKISLRDVGKYADNIIVQVINSRSIFVNVIAIGIGCCIVFEPQIFPIYDMGLLFSYREHSLPITMKNLGTRHYQIIWLRDPEMRLQKTQVTPTSKFQIEPAAVEVPANSYAIVRCKIRWHVNETLSENWYIFKQTQGQGKRELIGSSTFKATFTEPRIVFNKRELVFRIDIGPDGEKLQQIDELFVTNQSRLDLNVQLHVERPFYLTGDEQTFIRKKRIVLMKEATVTIPVNFLPSINRDKPYSQIYNGALRFEYDVHPSKDEIRCKGAINFPNITFSSRDLIINCIISSSAEETLQLTNNGPVPVMYKFLWLRESIKVQRDAHDGTVSFSEIFVRAKKKKYDYLSREIYAESHKSHSYGTKENSEILDNDSKKLFDSLSFNELQKSRSENLLTKADSGILNIMSEELRNISLSTIETSSSLHSEDTELLMDSEYPRKELLDDILDIIPHIGTVLPYSFETVRFIFHGSEPMQIKVIAVCEILEGPIELINVSASADVVRYAVDKRTLDFGQQLFGELCRSDFNLENRSTILLNYNIQENIVSNAGKSGMAIRELTIEPNKGSIDPLSSVEIRVEFQPMLLGAFEIELELQVAHLAPSIITVKGTTCLPQVYVYILRDDIFKEHPAELGYQAIQLLTTDYIAAKREIRTQDNDMKDDKSKDQAPSSGEEKILLCDEWDLVSYEEIFPSIADIEMAIDRFLATRFIRENISTLKEHFMLHKKAVIPFLYAPEYIIDMGYVTLNLKTCYSIRIINYGPWNVHVAMRKLQKKHEFKSSGILIQFRKSFLSVGEVTSLTLAWQPRSIKYTEKKTEEQHLIYLEVSRGYTIPIIIKGIITYPFVTVHKNLLDFQNVIIGECLMMSILVTNEGFIDCSWEANLLIDRKKGHENCPFHINYKSNLLSPGYSEIIQVYFKPRKTCHMEAKLRIVVQMGLETQLVTLLGRGVERKLHISDLDVSFPPTIPFTGIQEKVFTIKNICGYPVELVWHHLDNFFLEEERVAVALTRYYGVKEILLPPRELGKRIPSLIMEFYNSLVNEMAYALSAEVIEEESVTVLNGSSERRTSEGSIEFNIEKPKRKNYTGQLPVPLYSVQESHTAVSKFELPREPPVLSTSDPEEIQNLLLHYIETLRKDSNFCERMRDPVKELHDSLQTKSIPESDSIDSLQPAKRVCIIFHGAPFTKYQETACRSAKVLRVPLLCIDSAITEAIALGGNWSSVQLRRIIDDAYQEYLLAYEKHKEILETKPQETRRTDSKSAEHARGIIVKEKLSGQSISLEAIKAHPEATAEIDRHSRSDIPPRELIIGFETEAKSLEEFAKIPRGQDLESLDPMSHYEYKIRAISLLRRILPRYVTVEWTKDKIKEKSVGESQNNTFLGIEIGLLSEVLQERLSLPEYKSGFVLQTLDNIFIEDNVITLLTLLNIVGHVEYSLFVTFLNSMNNYIRKMEELRELKAKRLAEETAMRIQEIDEMSLSEYEVLAEDAKKFYLESTLPVKRQEALLRRMQFAERMTELRKRKKLSQQTSSVDILKNKRANKIMKNGKMDMNNQKENSVVSKAVTNRKEIHKEPKKKQEMPKELENIANAMNNYYSDLSAMENIIKDWDPIKKDVSIMVNNKVLKIDALKDDSSKKIYTGVFHLWYIRATDPWDHMMYDMLVNQMNENNLAKKAITIEISPKLDLETKKYYIFKPKDIKKRDTRSSGFYQIVSLSTISDPTVMEINSSHNSIINKPEDHTEYFSKRKKQSRNVNKTEDAKLLRASTAENNDASSVNTIVEEMLKPRWILHPNEIQEFKIRYQPKEMGIHQETYSLSIIDGNDITYDINVCAIADIPRLDMNPTAIFLKVEQTRIDDTNDPTYFLDACIYDFGSLLVFRKDKSVNRREAEFKFRNISEIEANVHFYLKENTPDIFLMEPEILHIQAGQCGSLKISAGVTKLGSFTDELYICTENNPHIDTIKIQCSGSKLDIELECKRLSFGQVLLYRREILTCTIRNDSPVQIVWHLKSDESLDQISFIPINGVVKARSKQKIEFCYCASKIGSIEANLTFKAFLNEDDVEAIFTKNFVLSGEAYDVAVDINHANPIDLKCVKVGFPVTEDFTIKNRGNYEVKYVVLLEEQDKLTKPPSNLPAKLKEVIEIHPVSGSIQSQKQETVQITFLPKSEIILKECPILRCHLLDMNKQATIIAELPLTVSLTAYYTRFRVFPYPEINFASIGICTKKTVYLNVENIGRFPLHYTIQLRSIRHPSVAYMTQIIKEDTVMKNPDKITDISARKDKKLSQLEDSTDRKTSASAVTLKVGPFTITRTEGKLEPGEIDTVAIECYPEFVGSQEEEIMILVPDSIPEDRNGKLITLSVNSCVPSIDFHDLDAMFHENHIVDRVQDFVCSKKIGAHTVFARQEKCLYFRHVSISHTYTACLVLYNRNAISADVELIVLPESLAPRTVKPDVFVVTPQREHIPPTSHKRFTISFNPTFIETCQAVLEIAVELPPHLRDEKFSVQLVGQGCVPDVVIVEPWHGKRELALLNFVHTLVDDCNKKKFSFENIGMIPAKVTVEIYEDPDFLFALSASESATTDLANGSDYQADTSNDRCTIVRLMPKEIASFEIKFSPRQIGKYEGQVRLLIADNPYENLIIDLKGEAYAELIVLEGLELNVKSNFINEMHESSPRSQKLSSRSSDATGVSTPTLLPISLVYKLNYSCCFVSKIYKRSFKIVNKSANQYLRFQWSTHPNVVFIPSIGHLKHLTCKEIVATFLSSEPANYVDIPLYCTICAIEVADPSKESCWDDRETEVRWVAMNPDMVEQETNVQTLAKKTVEPVNEPSHEIVPGTMKCIQVLLNATVAFSEYSCLVKEISFKDTLMFQTREHVFTLSNTGSVGLHYIWQINMDEQYPMKFATDYLRSTARSQEHTESRIILPTHTIHELHRWYSPSQAVMETDNGNVKLNGRQPLSSPGNIVEIKAATCRPFDLFSSTAGLTDRSSDSWLESDDMPFGIYPEKGILLPGESIECILRFSPMDIFDYKVYLTCRMENLDPKLLELVIPVAARSLLPYCHFDIPKTGYLSNGRRDTKLPGPIGYELDDGSLPEDIKVVEINVIGIGETHVKKFRMINPTSEGYYFTWRDRTFYAEDEIPNFHCVIPEGIAERGKQVDFSFTFLAEDVGIFESFWLFSVEKYNLECLFLFVAIVREPSICCSLVHLKLGPTILGVNVRESISIINNEEFQIPFQIAQDSLYSEGHFQSLQIIPMKDVLDAKGEQILWVEYHPTLVGEFQFSIKCIVKRMKAPLVILVTAITHDIIIFVTYVDQNGQVVRLNQDQENIIDCGKLMLKAPITIIFEITNSNKTMIYYSWDLGMTSEIISKNIYTITMYEKQGHVTSESRSNCSLTLTPLQKTVIKNHLVLLKISSGPTYRLILKATASKPLLEFSFNHYDFGPCYIQELTAAPYHVNLRITNSDNVPYILECNFEERPHISVNTDALSEAVAAHSSIIIPIKFRPLEQMRYRDNLHFTINSTIRKKITIAGEGIIYKIRLVESRDKSVDLGNIPINRTISKKVSVINDGRVAVELRFDLIKRLSGFQVLHERVQACPPKSTKEPKEDQFRASISETKRSDTHDAALQTIEPDITEVLEIEPVDTTTLQPGKIVNVIVKYKPTRRMRPFVAKVAFQTNSTILPLFILRGSGIGPEFSLNRTYLPFGTVIQGCSSEAKIVLFNTGDIGARFKWNTLKLPRDFSIAPMTGYCSPGMDVNFIVSFRPTRHDSLIEGNGSLVIEKYMVLDIKITGSCCKLPEAIDTLIFSCPVREKQTRSLNVENDTGTTWKLKPEITGDYFSVDEALHVPSKKFAICEITYAPLVMNNEINPHKGTLLLKLPNGKAPLVYSLQGLSLAPQVLERITRQFPAKTKYIELLSVYNWINKQQRFECKIENLDKNDLIEVPDVFTFVGSSKIDVPANSQRDYHAEFYSYKESKYNFKITFTNEEGEYQFYEFEYKVTKPEDIESIKFITAVRLPLCHTLRLENPLKEQQIVYRAMCQHSYITIHDIPKIVAPLSSETIGIEYNPLHPEESVIKLNVNCEELGLFPYELRLKATPAPAEKMMHVAAVLGSSSTFSLSIINHTRKNVIFVIKVDNNCFMIPKTVEVPALQEISFNVIYEPYDIDNVSATLTATSEIAGEFIFPLIGTYLLPKPQGPYVITPGAPALILFKNVFRDTKSFEFILHDPKVFSVTAPLERIEQKQVIDITICLKDLPSDKDESEHDSYPITGKLLVYCTDSRLSHINWIYYLRAIYNQRK